MIAAPFGGAWRLEVHDTLGSTSDEVLARAAAGEDAGLAVLARRQTKGRGTNGRSWSDGAGNLALSVLLRPGRAVAASGRLGIAAAVALHETLSVAAGPGAALGIKWPNDVLLGGRKLAGILVETAIATDGGIEWACIGLGANLAVAPDRGDVATACLAEIAPAPDPVRFARDLLGALTAWLDAGFDTVRSAWSARAHRLGEPLRVRRGDGVVTGRFVGLGERGELLVDTADGRVGLASGAVMPSTDAARRAG